MNTQHNSLVQLADSAAGRRQLQQCYSSQPEILTAQLQRIRTLAQRHRATFDGGRPLSLLSAPGRAEIIGNHTDHNLGCVLAAAVNQDTLAVVARRDDQRVRLDSEGYAPLEMDLSNLTMREDEKNTTAALIRGVAAYLQEKGIAIHGFDAAASSQVRSGSGLSSSAAVEVLFCAALEHLAGGVGLDPQQRAQAAQYAENAYFGKPSGLMDQMASSVGGLVAIDFACTPARVEPIAYQFEARGYAMVVVHAGGGHEQLGGYYAGIQQDMQQVARYLGAANLRAAGEQALRADLAGVRRACGERAVLRAIHFFDETRRVQLAAAALKKDDMEEFLRLIQASGDSSWQLLQNVYVPGPSQPLALALALAREQLSGRGACRVHGGGFAGTTLNFVPLALCQRFQSDMDAVFGQGAATILSVRPCGAGVIFQEGAYTHSQP